MARIIKLYDDVDLAVALSAETLLSGGIIVFPTDTVYGVMVRTTAQDGLAKVNRLKRRGEDQPVAALVSAEPALISLMRAWAGEVSRNPERLVPGPLTAIAPLQLWEGALPDELWELPYPAIGVRIPRHDALQRLLSACSGWAMASSANMEGMPTPATLAGVMGQLEGADIGLAVDGGDCDGEASGIISAHPKGISILRSHSLLSK